MSLIDTAITARTAEIRPQQIGGEQCRLEIHPWRDPIVERVGFDACGDYVELFWLAIIGPTSTWLLRRLAVMAVLHPEGFLLAAPEMAQALGLGADAGPRSSFSRSLQRLGIFGLVRSHGRRHEVRTVVPPLTLKHLARLPENLQCAHSLWTESDPSAAHELAFADTPRADESTSANSPTSQITASAW